MRNARYAGVVRPPVVRNARRAARDSVPGVVPNSARGAGVVPYWCGSAERPLCRVIACRGGAIMQGGTRATAASPPNPSLQPTAAREIVRFLTPLLRRARGR